VVDTISIGDNGGLTSLTHDLSQTHTRNLPALDEVTQDTASTDAGELINVSNDDDPNIFALGNGCEKLAEELDVHHRGFVYKDDLRNDLLNWLWHTLIQAAVHGTYESMDSGSLVAGDFLGPLRSLARISYTGGRSLGEHGFSAVRS